MNFVVDKNTELLKYLYEILKDESKNNIKKLLSNNCVFVNNKVITKFDYKLYQNDEIYIISKFIKDDSKFIEIVYEDNYLLILNKPHNLLTISTNKEKEKTLYRIVSNYLKCKNKNNKAFIVHRLDKDTSGIIIFAKSEKVQKLLQDNWNENVYREYLAFVHGKVNSNKVLKNYIAINKMGNSYITNKENGKLAISEYYVSKQYKDSSILKVIIKTGRKNQIRLQLAYDGYPIIGDRKYGRKDSKKIMHLHAYKIIFNHPITKKKLDLRTSYPPEFIK